MPILKLGEQLNTMFYVPPITDLVYILINLPIFNFYSFEYLNKLHDKRDMSAWVTDMKTKKPNYKNLYNICKSQDVLDHWRYKLNEWSFEDFQHVDF